MAANEDVIFLPGSPSAPVATIRGKQSYREWLKGEVARINCYPGRRLRVKEAKVDGRLKCWAVGNPSPLCVHKGE